MTRPMLAGVELEQVAEAQTQRTEVVADHAVPALEGDYLHRQGRQASRLALHGTITGPGARNALETIRKSFRAGQPVSFVTDIATATRVDQVLIGELGVRELAGKPERFEYAISLCEFLPAPKPAQQPPPTTGAAAAIDAEVSQDAEGLMKSMVAGLDAGQAFATGLERFVAPLSSLLGRLQKASGAFGGG